MLGPVEVSHDSMTIRRALRISHHAVLNFSTIGKCELRCANADYHEELSESQVELNSLRGLASPTYLVLTSPDPILTAFYMSRDLKTEAIERPEFREELLQLSQQCEHFAAELLDQCQTSEEVIKPNTSYNNILFTLYCASAVD